MPRWHHAEIFLFRHVEMSDLLEHDADFDCQHRGEEGEEDEEGQPHRGTAEVADGCPCGQHVLNGPRLSAELSHEPSAL